MPDSMSFIDTNTSMELNTPIKKIRELSIQSPPKSKINFGQQMEQVANADIFSLMVNRGYSRTISNKVLSEINLRASNISGKILSPPSSTSTSARRDRKSNQRKRYSGIHRINFNKMDSISSHYAATRPDLRSSPIKTEFVRSENVIDVDDIDLPHNDAGKRNSTIEISSATKRRRTLNGPEEVLNFNLTQLQEQEPISSPIKMNAECRLPPDNKPTLVKSPTISPHRSINNSPDRPINSSMKGISPSKGSMNLHGLLQTNENQENRHKTDANIYPTKLYSSSTSGEFLKPALPNKIRQSSLEMAGVKGLSLSTTPCLQKKSSTSSLNKKPSIPTLNKKPSVPTLNKKPSMQSLNKKPSIPTLNKKPSIPTLNKKPSIPTLNNKPSISSLNKQSSIPTLSRKPSTPALNTKPSLSTLNKQSMSDNNASKLPNDMSSRTLSKKPSYHELSKSRREISASVTSHSLADKTNLPVRSVSHSTLDSKNYTVPQPFSLYNKPTVSSSQKSLNLYENSGVSSSERSLNKFQKFKSRFH